MEAVKRIIVEPGDTLWDLCQKHLGDPYRWAVVAELNGLRNPHLIRPGQELVMPERREPEGVKG